MINIGTVPDLRKLFSPTWCNFQRLSNFKISGLTAGLFEARGSKQLKMGQAVERIRGDEARCRVPVCMTCGATLQCHVQGSPAIRTARVMYAPNFDRRIWFAKFIDSWTTEPCLQLTSFLFAGAKELPEGRFSCSVCFLRSIVHLSMWAFFFFENLCFLLTLRSTPHTLLIALVWELPKIFTVY